MSDQRVRGQERERLAAQRPDKTESTQLDEPQHPLVALGRQVGNAAVGRILAQRAAAPEEEDEALQLSRDPAVQRVSVEEEDEALQMSRGPEVGPEGGPVSAATASRIDALRGGGNALDQGVRAEMEGHLGASFADVRVHTGSEAAQLNRSLGARAFTTGSDVFFGAGAGPADKGLLAHELTHVVQQRGMAGGGPLTVGPADDAYEAEAENASATVSSGAAPAQRDHDDNRQG